MKYFWLALGHDLPIDLEAHRVAQERKLVRNLVERTGLQDLDEMNKLQATTSHKDIQADNSINDGTFFSILLLSETTFSKILVFPLFHLSFINMASTLNSL